MLIYVGHLRRHVATSFRGSFSFQWHRNRCPRGLMGDSLSVRSGPHDFLTGVAPSCPQSPQLTTSQTLNVPCHGSPLRSGCHSSSHSGEHFFPLVSDSSAFLV